LIKRTPRTVGVILVDKRTPRTVGGINVQSAAEKKDAHFKQKIRVVSQAKKFE
jgi:hypothetical protein